MGQTTNEEDEIVVAPAATAPPIAYATATTVPQPAYATATTVPQPTYPAEAAFPTAGTAQQLAYAPVPAAPAKNTSNPPPNVQDGGVWGRVRYRGNITNVVGCIGCFVFWPLLLICCCPIDEKDAYCVGGRLYDAAGNNLGSAADYAFDAKRSY